MVRGGAIAIRGGSGGERVKVAKVHALRIAAGGVKEGETEVNVEVQNSLMPHSGLGTRWGSHGNFSAVEKLEGVGSGTCETPTGGTESESYLILGMSISAVSTGGLGICKWKLERVKKSVKTSMWAGVLGCKNNGERANITFQGFPLMPIGEEEKYLINGENVSTLNMYMNFWGIWSFGAEFEG